MKYWVNWRCKSNKTKNSNFYVLHKRSEKKKVIDTRENRMPFSHTYTYSHTHTLAVIYVLYILHIHILEKQVMLISANIKMANHFYAKKNWGIEKPDNRHYLEYPICDKSYIPFQHIILFYSVYRMSTHTSLFASRGTFRLTCVPYPYTQPSVDPLSPDHHAIAAAVSQAPPSDVSR